MECFSIDQSMEYVIYGAGGNCHHMIRLLKAANYIVKAVIDKRAEFVCNVEGVPVYTLEDLSSRDTDKEMSVVIVSVKNVFEHINIARDLLDYGYRNLVYKPLPSLKGEHDQEWNAINKVYDIMVETRKLPDENENHLYVSRKNHLLTFRDELLVEQQENRVLCWLPMELICNYNRDDAYGLLPMAAYYPLLDLYQYLLGINLMQSWNEIKTNLYLYSMDWVDREKVDFTESLKQSMVHSRISIFYEMQKKADIDKDFFARNAVSVKLLTASKFYLTTSGRNRVTFLIAKGYRFIPVYMSQSDYQKWFHKAKYEEFEKFLEQKRIVKLFSIIPHPMLSAYDADAVDYIRLFGMPVLKELYKELHYQSVQKKENGYKINISEYKLRKKNLKVFSAIQDEGNISRILAMQEMQCYRFVKEKTMQELVRKIDELLGVDGSIYLQEVNDFSNIKECQVLILDSKMDTSIISEFQGNIVFLLLWETEQIPESIKNMFHVHKLLCKSIWNDKEVFGWMLSKEGKSI